MKKVGAVTIGQAPRTDILCDVEAILGVEIELIQAGADINAVDNEGNTALYYALKSGDAASARYLIKKGADYNRPNNQGETPVQVAVEEGFDTVLELMTDIK